MNKRILEWPHPKLKENCSPVSKFGYDLEQLVVDLVDTCNVNMGVGLAAPQIGVLKRVLVIKPEQFWFRNPEPLEYNKEYFALINPLIETYGDEKVKWEEGCLSFPQTSGRVERNKNCTVTYLNTAGETKNLEVPWPFSGGIQHECDHLDGVTFIFRQSRMSRSITLRKYQKEKKKLKRALKKSKRLD